MKDVLPIHHKLKKMLWFSIWLIVAAAIIAIGYYWYIHTINHPATDDAYVQANTAEISAQINGPINKIYVQNNQLVHKGQLLFSIDARPFKFELNKANAQLLLTQQQIETDIAAVNAAQANLAQAQANYQVAVKNVPRALTLVKEGQLSKAEGVTQQGQLDTAKAAVTAAQSQLQEALQTLGQPGADNANLLAAKANVAQAKLNLSYTKIYAPATGFVTNFSLRPGSMVTEGQALFALIETKAWWVDANYKETDLAHIQPGETASIVLDIYPHHIFHGVVQSISSGSGAVFSLLPPENATGNWVKVTQRFPVRVVFLHPDPKYPLRVGASATVTIDSQKS